MEKLKFRPKLDPMSPFPYITIAQQIKYRGSTACVMRFADLSPEEYSETLAALIRTDNHLFIVLKTPSRHPYMDLDNVKRSDIERLKCKFQERFGPMNIYVTSTSTNSEGYVSEHWRTDGRPVHPFDLSAFVCSLQLVSPPIRGVDEGVYAVRQMLRLPGQTKVLKPLNVARMIGAPTPIHLLKGDADQLQPCSTVDEPLVQKKPSQPRVGAVRPDLRPVFLRWPKGLPCPVANRVHDSDCTTYARSIFADSKTCIVYCHHSDCKGKPQSRVPLPM